MRRRLRHKLRMHPIYTHVMKKDLDSLPNLLDEVTG
jgi:hypothetical protein